MIRRERMEYYLRRFDPSRTVGWRWTEGSQRVQQRTRLSFNVDPGVRLAYRFAKYLQAQRQRPGLAREMMPQVARAYDFYLHGANDREEVDARLLAGSSFGDIAAVVGVDTVLISNYEYMFFNVSDRLYAKDWLRQQNLGIPNGIEDGQVWRCLALNVSFEDFDLVVNLERGRFRTSNVATGRMASWLRWCAIDCLYTINFVRPSAAFLEEGRSIQRAMSTGSKRSRDLDRLDGKLIDQVRADENRSAPVELRPEEGLKERIEWHARNYGPALRQLNQDLEREGIEDLKQLETRFGELSQQRSTLLIDLRSARKTATRMTEKKHAGGMKLANTALAEARGRLVELDFKTRRMTNDLVRQRCAHGKPDEIDKETLRRRKRICVVHQVLSTFYSQVLDDCEPYQFNQHDSGWAGQRRRGRRLAGQLLDVAFTWLAVDLKEAAKVARDHDVDLPTDLRDSATWDDLVKSTSARTAVWLRPGRAPAPVLMTGACSEAFQVLIAAAKKLRVAGYTSKYAAALHVVRGALALARPTNAQLSASVEEFDICWFETRWAMGRIAIEFTTQIPERLETHGCLKARGDAAQKLCDLAIDLLSCLQECNPNYATVIAERIRGRCRASKIEAAKLKQEIEAEAKKSANANSAQADEAAVPGWSRPEPVDYFDREKTDLTSVQRESIRVMLESIPWATGADSPDSNLKFPWTESEFKEWEAEFMEAGREWMRRSTDGGGGLDEPELNA